jgi:FMN phosphatase YigB (HAD superfamily)
MRVFLCPKFFIFDYFFYNLNMNEEFKIFCDMDGVLVDFDKGYFDLTGIDITGQHLNDENFWDPINKAGYNFWVNLEWKNDGKRLWDYIKKYNPELLSAPSRQNDSRVGKHDWVDKELPGVHLILRSAKHKKEFAAQNHILIDDRIDNIQGWRDSGGIGIHHINAKHTIDQLKSLGL